jgi:hypothetical protein
VTLALHAVVSDPVSVTLLADRTFPVQAGSRVIWTAIPSGGVGPFEYQFWLYSTALETWRIVQDFGGKPTFGWVPAAADTYMVRVRIRTAGLTAYENSATSSPFDITSASPPVVSALSGSVLFPVPAGTTVTWRATAWGGAGPLLYQFWIHDPVTGSGTAVIWNAEASGGAAELEYQFQLFRQSTGGWTTEQPYGPSSRGDW